MRTRAISYWKSFPAAAAVAAVALVALWACAAHAMPPGGVAPDFSLPDIHDEDVSHSLSEFGGRVVLINIWASWCSSCKEEMPGLVALQAAYDRSDLLVLAINIDKRKARAIEFLKRLGEESGGGTGLLVLYDGKGAVARRYGPRGMPTSYLVDRDGRISRTYVGAFDAAGFARLREDIDMLAGGGR